MSEPQDYQLIWSAEARAALRRMVGVAAAHVRKQLAARIREIDSRLRDNPTGLGEPYRSNGNIVESLAVLGFVAIDFAIDKKRRAVCVRELRALSGHGLDDASGA